MNHALVLILYPIGASHETKFLQATLPILPVVVLNSFTKYGLASVQLPEVVSLLVESYLWNLFNI